LDALKLIFPSFSHWILFVVLTLGPLTVFLGWLHLKRTPAFRSEQDIYYEANPYNFKLPPGYWREAVVPTMLEILRLNMKIINKESMTETEINQLKDLQKKLQLLIDGGFVGQPKRMYTPE